MMKSFNKGSAMEELLEQLETRIKNLLDKHEELQKTQQQWANEKKQLQEKHESAIAQIERMIARLKPLEEAM
jgi:uncharacterized protein (TIGR02449 family)